MVKNKKSIVINRSDVPVPSQGEGQQKVERLHALDSLRAIMMILGIVLHTAVTYGTFDHGELWSLKDSKSTHIIFDVIVGYIHAFRMPVFFVVAGFFGALLLHEKSIPEMLKNRVNRIVLPLIVFLLLLWPIQQVVWAYANAAMAGDPEPQRKAFALYVDVNLLLPKHTMHLWFLYYLVFYTLAGLCMQLAINQSKAIKNKLTEYFAFLMLTPLLRPLYFSFITFGILCSLQLVWVEKIGELLPQWEPLTFYFVFYLFGWFLFGWKKQLNNLIQYDWWVMSVALIAFGVKVYIYLAFSDIPIIPVMIINSIIAWYSIFAMMGLFLRYFSRHSPVMRYVSDAAYWVYLMHLPLTVFLPCLLLGWEASAFVKFGLVTGSTTLLCFVSYHYCVRRTFIGVFLNGRKY